MIIAEKLCMLRRYENAGLYQLSEPVPVDISNKMTEYVIISTILDGKIWETFIFPASKTGQIISWHEMEGSLKSLQKVQHEDAIRAAGWVPCQMDPWV